MYGHRLPVLWALKWFACKLTTVPDPDLEIKGGGGVGGGKRRRSPKKLFSALRASVWSKNKGEGGGVPKEDLFQFLDNLLDNLRELLSCHNWF